MTADTTTATDGSGAGPGRGADASAVERALAAAVADGIRFGELLDALSRGRLWVPLPDDGHPVTDGSAVTLPTVTYLGRDFIPAFTSARQLRQCLERLPLEPRPSPLAGPDPDPDTGDQGEPDVPHLVVPAAELTRHSGRRDVPRRGRAGRGRHLNQRARHPVLHALRNQAGSTAGAQPRVPSSSPWLKPGSFRS
jgi:SseB protein N-terminal domain